MNHTFISYILINSVQIPRKDGRDEDRINRALAVRHIYDNLDNPTVDTTDMNCEETVYKILEILKDY